MNYVSADEVACSPHAHYATPLAAALLAGQEEIALYLLSLPREMDSPPLSLDKPLGDEYKSMPLFSAAIFMGMVRVAEVLLGLGADLLARDLDGHLAVCHAVIICHVDVANVLLKAHAKQAGGAKAVLEFPCRQNHGKKGMYPLLFHTLAPAKIMVTPDARLAMVRCLVEKWSANVRALLSYGGVLLYYPLFIAACCTHHNVVAYFLNDCGLDVNSATPWAKETVLHALVRYRPSSRREEVRMLKYLVEEKGPDISFENDMGEDVWDLARQTNNATFFNYLLIVRDGVPKSVDELTRSDEWKLPNKKKAAMMKAEC